MRKATAAPQGLGNLANGETITVFFASSVEYYQHTCVLIVSILENNRRSRFDFHVMTDRKDLPARRKILSLQNKYPNCVITFTVVSEELFADLPEVGQLPRQTYFRFLIPLTFPHLDKALYFDSDMVCVGNLRPFWNTNLDGHYIAGVSDKRHFLLRFGQTLWNKLGFGENDEYINTGSALWNLKKMREDYFTEKCFSAIEKMADFITNYDQDAVNIVARNKIKLIAPIYNYFPDFSGRRSAQEEQNIKPVILHFYGSQKPWNGSAVQDNPFYNRYCGYYYQYLRKTPYRSRWFLYCVFYPLKRKLREAGRRAARRIQQLLRKPEQLFRKWLDTAGSEKKKAEILPSDRIREERPEKEAA